MLKNAGLLTVKTKQFELTTAVGLKINSGFGIRVYALMYADNFFAVLSSALSIGPQRFSLPCLTAV